MVDTQLTLFLAGAFLGRAARRGRGDVVGTSPSEQELPDVVKQRRSNEVFGVERLGHVREPLDGSGNGQGM